jgi:uncharacterized protein YsxB (DUF464 family)
MIRFTVWKSEDQYKGFESSGHAGYADAGEDIICSAVSVLAINTVNSIEKFTADDYVVEQADDGGFLRLRFEEPLSERAGLLMDSLVLGIESIQAEYGKDYIILITEEV